MCRESLCHTAVVSKATLGEIVGAYVRDRDNNDGEKTVGRVALIQRQLTRRKSANRLSPLALGLGTSLDTRLSRVIGVGPGRNETCCESILQRTQSASEHVFCPP